MSKFEPKIIENIKKYGCHVMCVFGEGGSPGFAYSVGMEKTYGQPEIVVIGLRAELGHALINNLAQEYKAGKTYKSEHFYSDIVENFDCAMLDVDKKYYDDYFGQAQWYYGNDDFRVQQIVYPTAKGSFPWDEDFPAEMKNWMLILNHDFMNKIQASNG